jgi:O-antigen ligase
MLGAGLLVLQSQALAVISSFGSTLFRPLTNTSFVFRVFGWYHDVLPAIRQAPVFGHGTGMAKDGLGPYTSHSILFKILLEGGVLLLAIYLLAIVIVTTLLLRNLRQGRPQRVALACLVGVHVAGLFIPLLDTYPGNLYFWMMLGSGLAWSSTQQDVGKAVVPQVSQEDGSPAQHSA